MSDIINLNKARKNQKKQAEKTTAAANRLLHGQTKAEKNLHKAKQAQQEKKQEQHHLEKDKPEIKE
ncbi:MAG: DUF4169 family protein [Alphaproteobacteria bacterium]